MADTIINLEDYRATKKIKDIDFGEKLHLYRTWSGFTITEDLDKVQLVYDTLNKIYFGSELPRIPLLITTTFKGLEEDGETTEGSFRYNLDEKGYEHIILKSITFTDAEDILAHEMLHFYNYLHDIDDYNDETHEHKPAFLAQAKALSLPTRHGIENIIYGVEHDKAFLNAILSDKEVLVELAQTLQKGATTQ